MKHFQTGCEPVLVQIPPDLNLGLSSSIAVASLIHTCKLGAEIPLLATNYGHCRPPLNALGAQAAMNPSQAGHKRIGHDALSRGLLLANSLLSS